MASLWFGAIFFISLIDVSDSWVPLIGVENSQASRDQISHIPPQPSSGRKLLRGPSRRVATCSGRLNKTRLSVFHDSNMPEETTVEELSQ